MIQTQVEGGSLNLFPVHASIDHRATSAPACGVRRHVTVTPVIGRIGLDE
jgi:hypothetical protein